MLKACAFTRNDGKAGGAGGRLALLTGCGVSPQPLFSSAAEGGKTDKTGKRTSPVRLLSRSEQVIKSDHIGIIFVRTPLELLEDMHHTGNVYFAINIQGCDQCELC
ncbi:MAG: hypothetical protein E6J34_05445 [Chloroflexi bacterium]|nr:MAG: hypothetical protein E6J34_05445 [Chloroflexota bacterium]